LSIGAPPAIIRFLMLKFLRNKKIQKRLYLVLAIGVLVPFSFWGVELSKKGAQNPGTWLGVIDNHKVSIQEYLSSYKAVEREIQLRYGEKAGAMKSMINLKGEAWDRILLLHYAKKEKIKTSDDEVVDWLLEQPLFVHQGKFDTDFYKRYVTGYMKTSTRDFEEEARGFLTINKVVTGAASKTSVSDEELKKLYLAQNAERDIAYAILPWESEKEKVQVEDAEIQSIYPIVKDKLTTAEKSERPLSFEESKEEVRKIILRQKATEAAVKKLEDLRKKMDTSGFEAVLQAEKIEIKNFEKFNAGAGFKPTPTLPDLGPSEGVEKAISGLKAGEISKAFAAPSGAVLVKILKDRPVDDKKFAKDKEKFKAKILDNKKEQAVQSLLEKLRKDLKLNLEAMKALFSEENP